MPFIRFHNLRKNLIFKSHSLKSPERPGAIQQQRELEWDWEWEFQMAECLNGDSESEWKCVGDMTLKPKPTLCYRCSCSCSATPAACHVTNLEMTKYTMKNAHPKQDNRHFFCHRHPSQLFFAQVFCIWSLPGCLAGVLDCHNWVCDALNWNCSARYGVNKKLSSV